jgi:hypothetical protein
MIKRPQPDEYPVYAAKYVNLVGDDPILNILEYNQQNTFDFFTGIDPQKADYAYAAGKWTVQQVLGHIADTERILAFRALVFSRDAVELPGFDQDIYAENADFNLRTLENLAAELKTIRESNLYLFRSITDEQSMQKGIANGNPISVRGLIYMIAGHELHHINILKERYL